MKYLIRKGRVNPMCDEHGGSCQTRWHVCLSVPEVQDWPMVLEVVDDWEEARDYVVNDLITR